MAYDPKTIYKKLAELLGGTKGSAAESRGEYMDVPGIGEIRVGAFERMVPKSQGGWAPEWDQREIWETGSPETGYKPRYAEGNVPDWMKNKANLFTQGVASGGMDPDEIQGLAQHWLDSRTTDKSMPEWVKAYLTGIYGGYASGGSGQTNPGPGGPGTV